MNNASNGTNGHRPRWADLPIDPQALEVSTRDVAEAVMLPAEVYTSQAFYDFEMEAVFAREWVCVGRTEQIPNPGDYFTVTVVEDPLIVMRGEDGVIRAMSSVCRHRGAVLVEGSGNCGRRLSCPYHAWTYDLEGRLRGAPEMARTPGFDRANTRLPQVALEDWKGFLFVNLDGNAPPLGPRLVAVDDLIGNYRLEKLASLPTTTYELAWNWKVMIENFMECYHCSYLHAGYHDCAPTRNLVIPPPL